MQGFHLRVPLREEVLQAFGADGIGFSDPLHVLGLAERMLFVTGAVVSRHALLQATSHFRQAALVERLRLRGKTGKLGFDLLPPLVHQVLGEFLAIAKGLADPGTLVGEVLFQ